MKKDVLVGDVPSSYLLVFTFLVAATFPATLMYVFVAYRKYVLCSLLFV